MLFVTPIDFDGRSDALMHAFTADGTRHMEYVGTTFDDLPLDRILAALDQAYGPIVTAAAGLTTPSPAANPESPVHPKTGPPDGRSRRCCGSE